MRKNHFFQYINSIRQRIRFQGSRNYWETRYMKRETSGRGSYGKLAVFKANTINDFVANHNIESVIEFGVGDGSQLSLFTFKRYIGLDISTTAIQMCIEKFEHDKDKSFFLYDNKCFHDNAGIFQHEAALSLDVIYHLVEDDVFETYMQHLFICATRYVIIYSSNIELRQSTPHVKHRKFTDWITQNALEWKLLHIVENIHPPDGEQNISEGSLANFYIFEKEH